MPQSFQIALNYSVYAEQDLIKALKRISELEKENKELKEKNKSFNRLSRLKNKK